ncbi:imelysin family protein [Atopomonas sediminilitoris]|uniref:imelysin family protein n=1 Tax=Atopomonas sediminilitoris TaxID=2919919 RepID=UPI001F4EB392|nr:imelysin family protein [Atopomonas sediminilitoris]MCJ8168712.1 peptidase [Atopomonas sediminilitoris]
MYSTRLASASLLALSIALAGCGQEDAAKPSTEATTPAVSTSTETAKTANTFDSQAASAVVSHYADMALAVFEDALTSAKTLQASIDALLAEPTQANLDAARSAWIAARKPYMQSEVFRFGNAVVDDWEGQLNAWPLDEGLIDYVASEYQHALGNPGASANIIANPQLSLGDQTLDLAKLTPELLAELNELGGSEANVATGYHAIEFLLWGQDLNGSNPGAGERPATDFAQDENCSNQHCARRAEYLKTVTALLVSDLEYMVGQWQQGQADNYRATLLGETPEQGLRKMLFGMGSLSLGELAGERMKVALEANSTEDEHDCFSDNTHNSHFFNAKGIRNVYLGEYQRIDGSSVKGASLSELVKASNAEADQKLQNELANTETALQKLVDSANNGTHFDQLIAAGNDQGNAIVTESIQALVAQTSGIEAAAAAIGITELNPDTADHQF